MKYCYKCGAEYPKDDAAFCVECGEKAPSKGAAAGGKGAKSASKSSPPAAEQTSSVPAPAAPKPPKKRRAALWVAWVVVGLLAAGNIFQGLYFGVFKDGDSSSETAVVADVTTTLGVSTTTTVAPATTTTSGTSLPGQAVSADAAGTKALVRNAMTIIESTYVELRTFDMASLTPEYLASEEPSITFVPTAPGTPASPVSGEAVVYYGEGDRCLVSAWDASGTEYSMVVDKTEGSSLYLFFVDGEEVSQW